MKRLNICRTSVARERSSTQVKTSLYRTVNKQTDRSILVQSLETISLFLIQTMEFQVREQRKFAYEEKEEVSYTYIYITLCSFRVGQGSYCFANNLTRVTYMTVCQKYSDDQRFFFIRNRRSNFLLSLKSIYG